MRATLTETRTGLEVLLREPTADDRAYVMATPWPCIRSGPSYAGLTKRLFDDTVGARYKELWSDGMTIRVVACLPEQEDFILGYAFGDPRAPILHYAHVRGDFRRQRIGTLLLEMLDIDRDTLAAVTFDSRDLRRNIANGWRLRLAGEL